MVTATEINNSFSKFKTDKGVTHGYHRWYEKIFKNFTPTTLLEIGVKQGNSLAAWKHLFPNCSVSGLDITDKDFVPKLIEYSKANIIIADSTEPKTLDLLEETYDVIIDDGSHFYNDIFSTFDLLKERFKHYYIIEDSMYLNDVLIDYIKSLGFTVRMFPSQNSNIPVNLNYLSKGKKSKKDFDIVSLFMIVIYKNL